MIDKQDFYHGAALIPLVTHPECRSIGWIRSGYVVNQSILAVLKYTTKNRSPWRFTFRRDELDAIINDAAQYPHCVVVFINGGDGLSAVTLDELLFLLGDEPGWVSMKRRFNEMYAVTGQVNSLRNKVSLSRWPSLAFTVNGNNHQESL